MLFCLGRCGQSCLSPELGPLYELRAATDSHDCQRDDGPRQISRRGQRITSGTDSAGGRRLRLWAIVVDRLDLRFAFLHL